MDIEFTKNITNWYQENSRDLPWRNTKNPYFIWLSEVILQQTRVAQGLHYYLRFVKKYPTVFDLAKADEQEILKLWQGLGYYSRARNLHFSAKYIVNECKGVFPATYKQLLKLKGVGDYTASAIASICFNEPTAVVDGNVYRVLARYLGIKTAINTSKGISEFKKLAQALLDKKQPGTYNQAIMDFGALQCKPQSPNCKECILNKVCVAWLSNNVSKLPAKERKVTIKKLYFNYLFFITKDNTTVLEKRTKGIWQNLYQFPLIETDTKIKMLELVKHPIFISFVNSEPFKITSFYKKEKIHKLSHRHIYTQFWVIKIKNVKEKNVPFSSIDKYPVPILIHHFLEDFYRWRKQI